MNKLVVQHVQWLSWDIYELALERQGVPFTPGDCVAIYNEGRDGRDGESRSYSIASGASEGSLRFVIRRLSGGAVSDYLCGLQPGQRVRVSDPFGWFRPARGGPTGAPSVFIATGTGMAPFLSTLRSYPAEVPAAFLLGVRHLADAVALPFLQARGGVRLAVSRQRVSPHHHGRVTDLIDGTVHRSETHYYLCGLDAMIDDVTARLESHNVDPGHIHREVFFHA